MSEREQLSATSGPMSKDENAQSERLLQDDELDFVSGGGGSGSEAVPMEQVSFKWGANNPTTVGLSFGASKDRGFS